jgi:colanic acid/amylovoran biosynthesis glycosyltransferase
MIVASYCTTFLKPEMLHIYRQVSGLQRYRTFVVAKELECPDRFPFDEVELLPPLRPRFHPAYLKHLYLKHIRRLPPLYYRGEIQPMMKIFERRHADLMHIYFGHTGVHLLPFVEWWQQPCIVSFHGADVMLRENKRGYAGQMRRLLETVPLVLARSQSLANRLEAIGCPKEKIRLNRTGIPLADFPFVQRAAPANGAWRLVQTCRLIPKKGLRSALQAFAQFRRSFPNATYTIAGEGPMRGELEALAGELGLGSAVVFPGFLDQRGLNELYANSHLFLHPSELTQDQNQEGIPNSMLEAMATGLPVVATFHGGIPEAVDHERTGLLAPERDPEALCASLLKLTQNPQELLTMGLRASESVRAEFEQRRAIEKLEACYDEAVQIGKLS